MGLGAVIKGIPANFTGETQDSQVAMRNFCRQYSRLQTDDRRYSEYQENIIERAYDSFDRCVASADDRVTVYHTVRASDQLDFFIQPGLNRFVNIRGVAYDENTTCTAIHPQHRREEVLDRGSHIYLEAGQTLNIGCTRRPTQSSDGTRTFHESSIVVYTDTRHGNYAAYVPRDERLPEDRAILLNQRVAACEESNVSLRTGLNSLTARLAGVQSTAETFYIGESGIGANHRGCNTNPQQAATQLCRKRLPGSTATYRQTRSAPGGQCGYHFYIVSCVRIPD